MAVVMTDDGRDYPSLWLKLCDCPGPQLSPKRPRADEHGRECPYRKEVEGEK